MDYLFRYLASKFVKQEAAPVEETATAPAPATEEIQRVAEVVAAAQKIEVLDDRRVAPRNGTNGHANGHKSGSSKGGGASHTGNGNYSFIARTDAPTCPECGSIMIPNGSCHKCVNCGTTSGCS
jgi:ribonucleoside-diphosphate reductase alpha chain